MLKTSKLLLGYRGKPLLHFPDTTLEKGTQCLISGASGSGKTTLFYTLAGLLPPLSGQVIINDTDIASLPEAIRDRFRGQHIGIIFQTLHLVKSLSVLDNLLLAAYMAKYPVEERYAIDMLATLGIESKRHTLPAELSQGQAQRAAIARALLLKPALLLADEPTSSLDDDNSETVISLLTSLAKEQDTTLLVSTHDNRIKTHFEHVISLGETL